MKKFCLYIICTMIITYFDIKYNLKSILLFAFFIASLFFFKGIERSFKIAFFKVNKLFIIYLLLLSLIFSLFFSLLPILMFQNYQIDSIVNYTDYEILTALLLTPFLEELIFRGSLLPLLKKTLTSGKAILLSSLGFSLTHYFSSSGLFTVFILGLVLGYIYVKTKSVILCFSFHFLNNFFALVLLPFFLFIAEIKEIDGLSFLFTILSFIIMLFLSYKIYKYKLHY